MNCGECTHLWCQCWIISGKPALWLENCQTRRIKSEETAQARRLCQGDVPAGVLDNSRKSSPSVRISSENTLRAASRSFSQHVVQFCSKRQELFHCAPPFLMANRPKDSFSRDLMHRGCSVQRKQNMVVLALKTVPTECGDSHSGSTASSYWKSSHTGASKLYGR